MKKVGALLSAVLCIVVSNSFAQKVTLTVTSKSDCKPLVITASVSTSGFSNAIESYEWNFGDAVMVTETNKTNFTYTSSGVKNISVTVKAGAISKASAVQTITVEEFCIEDGTKSGGSGGFTFTRGACGAPFTVQFKDDFSSTRANNAVVAEWDLGDGTIITGADAKTTISHTYSTNETSIYFVNVKRKDKTTGAPLASGTKRIILVNEFAKFKVKNDLADEFCTETRISFLNDGMRGLGIKKFEWDFGDEKKYTVNNTDYDVTEDGATSHQYNIAGSFTASLKITDRAGCTNAYAYPVKIRIKGPKADFLNKTSIGCGDNFSIDFTDLCTPGMYAPLEEWKWYVDNVMVDTYKGVNSKPTVSLPFTNNGLYKKFNVKLVILDAEGCASTLSKTNVIVGSNPKADFSVDTSQACAPLILHFKNNSQVNNNNNSYTWQFGIADSSVLSKEASFSYQHGGSYNALLKLTDSCGCKDEKLVSFKINGPYGKMTADKFEGCAPFSFKPLLTGINFSTANWDWKDNIETNAVILPEPHVYNDAGEYTPVVTLYDEQGCSFSASAEKPVIIDKIKAGFSIVRTSFCGSGEINITDLSSVGEASHIAEYMWDFGDSTTSSDPQPAPHAYTEPGKYNVVLSAKSKYGCTDESIPQQVEVLNNPVVTLTGPEEICVSSQPEFGIAALVFNDSIINKYFRYYNLLENQYTESIAPGEYIVAAIAETVKGCKDSVTKRLTVHPLPNLVLSNDTTICKNTTIHLSAEGASSYYWYTDDVTPIQNAYSNTLLITPTESTNYLIHGTSIHGCAKDSSISVKIDNPVSLSVSAPAGICKEGSVKLWAKSTTNSFIWSNENTLDDRYSATPIASPHVTTRYTVTGISNNTCPDETDSVLVSVYEKPAVHITGNEIVCLKANVASLNYNPAITSADAISSYLWQLDDSTISNNQNLYYDFRASGAHALQLIATTINGCSDTTIKQIIIDSVYADFLILDSIKCGDDKTVSFESKVSSAYPVTGYVWQFGDGITNSNASAQHTYTSAGTFPVSLLVKTENNCVDQVSKQQAAIIYNKPVITFNTDKEKCFKEQFNYTSSIESEDEIISQQLHIYTDDGKEIFQPLPQGNYDLSYIVTTTHGCKDSAMQTLVVHPLPDIVMNSDTMICKNSTINLFASGARSYSWTTDGNTFIQNPNQPTPMITPEADAHYFVHAVNEYGCAKDSSVVVRVAEPVVISVSPPVTICEGDRTKIWVSGNVTNFTWNNANTLNNAQSAMPWASPLVSTSYVVKASGDNICPDATDSVQVTVVKKPTVNLGGDISTAVGTVISFQPTVTGNIASYKWQPTTGLSCSICANPRLTADQNTTYSLTVSTKEGCNTSDKINIYVLCNKSSVYIPDAFTPNGDGKNDVFYIMGSGIQSIKRFSVFDRYGKIVFHKENCNANDRNAGWNGLVGGKPVSQSTTFIYTAEVVCGEGNNIQLKGTVVLIR